jgi:hypothetical protein
MTIFAFKDVGLNQKHYTYLDFEQVMKLTDIEAITGEFSYPFLSNKQIEKIKQHYKNIGVEVLILATHNLSERDYI